MSHGDWEIELWAAIAAMIVVAAFVALLFSL